MCDHRYRVGRWVYPGTWTNDPKAMAWDVGHPEDFGRVTPGAGSGRCGLPGDCVLISQVQVLEGGSHPGDYGLVTQGAVSGKRLTLETVIPCIWAWGSPWILQTLESRYSVWEGCHP